MYSSKKKRSNPQRWCRSLLSTFHRHVVHPGADLSNEDPRVAAIAAATWTEEVVAAYQASLPQPEETAE